MLSNDVLVSLGLQASGGCLSGFLLGYGVKKITKLLLTVSSIVLALVMLPLIWLANIGVITVDYDKLLALLESGSSQAVAGFSNLASQGFSSISVIGGAFALSFLAGFKKG